MTIASTSTKSLKFVVARNRLSRTAAAILAPETGFDIALTGVDRVDFNWVNIKPDHTEAGRRDSQRQRHSDVAEADDGDRCALLRKELKEL